MRICRWHILWLLVLAVELRAQAPAPVEWTEAAIREELSAPIKVQSKVGRDFVGIARSVDAERIVLQTRVAGGSVEYTFKSDEIVLVQLPGGALKPHALDLIEGGRATEGLDLLERLFAQREPFFGYLPFSEAAFFAEQLPLFREHGAPAKGLALARAVEPWVREDDRWGAVARDEILLGEFLVGDPQTAESLAQEWLAAAPREATSALGWYVLGALEAQREAYDAAWFTWMHPIVFSGRRPMPYLPECYARAIRAGIELERISEARRLLAEMEARVLAWPPQIPAPEFPPPEESNDAASPEESAETASDL